MLFCSKQLKTSLGQKKKKKENVVTGFISIFLTGSKKKCRLLKVWKNDMVICNSDPLFKPVFSV